MLKTILLYAVSVLIFVDGMTTQSLEKIEPDWKSGTLFGMSNAPKVDDIDYPDRTDALHYLLTGGKSEATIADYYRLRYGYNARIYALATDSARVKELGAHSVNKMLCYTTTDSLLNELAIRMKRDRIGEEGTHDLILVSLSALAEHSNSDIVVSRADERAYEQMASTLSRLIGLFGKKGAEFHIYGIPYYGIGADWMERLDMSNISMEEDQVLALTNAYLMALYGPKKWITEVTAEKVVLNQEAIDKEMINVSDITLRTASFLNKFSAIRHAKVSETNPMEIEVETASPHLPSPFLSYPAITYPTNAEKHPLL